MTDPAPSLESNPGALLQLTEAELADLRHTVKQRRWYLVVLALTIGLPIAIYAPLARSAYQGSADLHAAIDSVGALLALISGFALIARFYSLGNRFHLFIGLGFLVSGAEDFVLCILLFDYTHKLLGLPPALLARLIPGVYVSGRLFMGVVLLIAPFTPRWLGPLRDPKRETKTTSLIVLTGVAVMTALVLLLPLHNWVFPNRLLSRPADCVAAMVLLGALWVFIRDYERRGDTLIWWIALAIGLNIAGMILMAFSTHLYDAFFGIAHVHKVLGYVPPLVGFCLHEISTIAERQKTAEALRKARDELELRVQERTAELTEANQALLESEQRFRGFVETTSDWIWEIDVNGRYTYSSPQVKDLLGYEPEEILGRTMFEFMPPAEAERVSALFSGTVEAKEPYIRLENTLRHQDGRRLVIETSGAPILDAEGQLVGYRGMDRDVTARKKVERTMEWESGFNQAMAEVSSALLWAARIEDLSALVFEHVKRLTNSPAGFVGCVDQQTEHLVCTTFTKGSWPAQETEEGTLVFEDPDEVWSGVLRTQKPTMVNQVAEDPRWEGLSAAEGPVHRFLSAPAVFGDRVFGQVAVANAGREYDRQDLVVVTQLAALYALAIQRIRAEQELEAATEELRRSNRELEQFAYVASHDLQEPLRMVASYVQLLARRYQGKLDASADDFIRFAVEGAQRMQTLIQDLLSYSRVRRKGKQFAPTSCEAVLAQAVENLQVSIAESDAEITHEPLPTVIADETQLLQLLQNLISNAIKFRSPQPLKIHVTACPAEDGPPAGAEEPGPREHNPETWVFSVSDNGIGLQPEHAERIFMIFQRLHTRDEYPGTGIGLAVCKRIVERHGGQIWVESEPGEGATFYFTIAPREGGGKEPEVEEE